MIRYRANCPGCGRECWWHGYAVQRPEGNQGCLVQVHCHDCDKDERIERAERVLVSTGTLWVD